MSVIQSIRDKGAWVIFGIIALALIAFILQDGVGRGRSANNNTDMRRVKLGYKRMSVLGGQRIKWLTPCRVNGHKVVFSGNIRGMNLFIWRNRVSNVCLKIVI